MKRLEPVHVDSLLTLTTNPFRHRDPKQAFFSVSLAVGHLIKRLRRHWPLSAVEYWLVWEVTAKGWPHAHVLLRAPYIPQAWLSTNWEELTGAPIIDIRAIKGSGPVRSYVLKYLSKEPAVPAGCRRYRSSRRFFPRADVNVGAPPRTTLWWIVRLPCIIVASDYIKYQRFTLEEHHGGAYNLVRAPPETKNEPARPYTYPLLV